MNSATKVSHPIFARMYARIGAVAEKKGNAEHRDEMLAGLQGRVIEVGAGIGLNFRHYPEGVTEVVAVEPEPLLRRMATEEAARSGLPIEVVDGVSDALPADDGAFDVGIASLVLCSVADPDAALGELFRVIRPGGELRFLEHVRATSSGFARFSGRLTSSIPGSAAAVTPAATPSERSRRRVSSSRRSVASASRRASWTRPSHHTSSVEPVAPREEDPMTIVKLVCSLGCTLMLVAGLGYMAIAAVRRPRTTSGPTRDPDALEQPGTVGVGTGASTP
jgi:ubiquinone/menaquinone biosynthesis C-methylase UbiE